MKRPRKAKWDQPVGDQPNQHVGAMLHGLREQAGLTQAQVASDIGIDPSLISRVERGSRPASDRIIRYYGERFGAPDLLAGLTSLPASPSATADDDGTLYSSPARRATHSMGTRPGSSPRRPRTAPLSPAAPPS